MASNRRLGTENAESRYILLDAAEQLMSDKGYAAVTSRNVAKQAGLKPQLVHYYFRTMDDLFIALFRKMADRYLQHIDEIITLEKPLIPLWKLSCDTSAMLLTEFLALANHKESIRLEILAFGKKYHHKQVQILEDVMERNGIDQTVWPPTALAVILENLSRSLVMGEAIGMSVGRNSVWKVVSRVLKELECPHQTNSPETSA